MIGLALLVLLSACGLTEESRQLTCPALVVVPEASRLIKFAGSGRDLTDVGYEIQIVEPTMTCSFDEEESAIRGDLTLRFIATQGPANETSQAEFAYFIAIAGAGGRRVLTREEFALSVPFAGAQSRVGVTDGLEPRIPLNPDQDGSEYQLYIGLALSEEELEYNRENL